jgi:predicted Zn-dependent peptidase
MEHKLFNSEEYILDNGIKLVSLQKSTKLSSVFVGISTGAMDEEKEERGICHFIEHMLFKGTEKRDNNRINQDLEERAGFYDAYTDYTGTVFSITALSEELESSIEILSDIIINSNFPKKEIEKERGVILAEIKSGIDDIEQYSFSKVHEVAFKKSPLRYDVIGREETVKSFTREQLISFYQKHYVPNNCTICIVSPFEHEQIRELVEKYFHNWKGRKGSKKDIVIEKNKSIEKISYKSNIEQNTLIYLYTFHGLTREEELALDILNHKLGESPNSILFRSLREERGLAYDIYSQMDATEGIKTLYIYTAVGESDLREAKYIIEDCIEKVKSRQITLDNRDIMIMKKVMKTSIASILEDAQGLSNYVLHQKMMDKKINQFVDDMKKLENIEVEDVYRVADKVLNEPTIHILMNKK